MAIDPITAVTVGSSILDGVFSALDNGDVEEARRQLEQARRQFEQGMTQRQHEFGRTQGQSEAMDVLDVQRNIDSSPLRDQVMAMMKARIGAPPQSFVPRDPLRPPGGTQATGSAADPTGQMEVMRNAASNYTPGSGGVDTSTAESVKAMLMGNMSRPVPAPPTMPKYGPDGRPIDKVGGLEESERMTPYRMSNKFSRGMR